MASFCHVFIDCKAHRRGLHSLTMVLISHSSQGDGLREQQEGFHSLSPAQSPPPRNEYRRIHNPQSRPSKYLSIPPVKEVNTVPTTPAVAHIPPKTHLTSQSSTDGSCANRQRPRRRPYPYYTHPLHLSPPSRNHPPRTRNKRERAPPPPETQRSLLPHLPAEMDISTT